MMFSPDHTEWKVVALLQIPVRCNGKTDAGHGAGLLREQVIHLWCSSALQRGDQSNDMNMPNVYFRVQSLQIRNEKYKENHFIEVEAQRSALKDYSSWSVLKVCTQCLIFEQSQEWIIQILIQNIVFNFNESCLYYEFNKKGSRQKDNISEIQHIGHIMVWKPLANFIKMIVNLKL